MNKIKIGELTFLANGDIIFKNIETESKKEAISTTFRSIKELKESSSPRAIISYKLKYLSQIISIIKFLVKSIPFIFKIIGFINDTDSS
ncbi:MAG: hypothetical protein V4667_12550 [Bacteroidota bacterium]